MAGSVEELIHSLYEMIQDAWMIPLGGDKCVVEKEKVLDILDEIIAVLPNDLKMARDIVEKRNDVILSGKRESEAIKRQAEEQARMMLSENEIVQEARKKANDIISAARTRSNELRKAANDYCEDSLKRTEESVIKALEDIKQSRQEFKNAAIKAAKQE
ncbi:MAG: hypothetical protein Q8878_03195 [Bacillota bacterium]|nr:hypothetical protein [Bacillota bacterium]